MMIISQKAMLDELATLKRTGMDIRKANLCILLASNFMDQAYDSLYSPKYMTDLPEEQKERYSKVYDQVKIISEKLQDLSKFSTRLVQDC